jgi:F0F1-type ATP synthase alpha subunit
MSQVFKGGSLTALPIVETLVGDISSYIPTNVISITDGQIFLDNQIFNKHYKPAVNIELSVSRVGAKAQLRFYRKISKTFKNALLKYYLKADQINISDNKGETDNVVVLGQRLFIIVTHKNLMCIELQFFLMYLALSGYLNNYSLEQVSRLITKLGLSYTQNFNLNINFFKNIKL